jgi:photosynthetic reaction center H subunit
MLMQVGSIMSNIDVAQVVLYAFWIFFAGLIWHLRTEDKREGYPLVEGPNGSRGQGFPPMPEPKVFRLSNGTTVLAPAPGRSDDRPIRAEAFEPWGGAPLYPLGDPMLASVGPGAYAQRADAPDLNLDGAPKIAPLRAAADLHIDSRDPDPRGMTVFGADGRVAGTVKDVWVDRMEVIVRFLEVDAGGRSVLVPMPLAQIDRRRKCVKVNSVLAAQFAAAPALRSPDQVTLLEEDKIGAYFGGGYLYATPSRAEPLL